jgi:hypothetical protein
MFYMFGQYLSDRQPLDGVSGTFSSRKSVTFGVPEGSI